MKKAYRFGVEIECTVPRGNLDELRKKVIRLGCDVGADGSIRTEDMGLEIKTKPMGFNRLARLLTKIEKLCEENNVEVNRSCGMHIHVSNKRFYLVKNLRRIAMLWVAIEDVLFATQPESRLQNQYCERKLKQFITDGLPKLPHQKDELVSELASHNRYYALNFASMQRHGTIECRLHTGTTSARKIASWAKLLQAIYTYAMTKYNEKEIKRLFETKTTEVKIAKAWDVLGLDTNLKSYLNTRVQKFLLPKLAQQQEAAIKAIKLQPVQQRIEKKYRQMREELDRIRSEQSLILRAFA